MNRAFAPLVLLSLTLASLPSVAWGWGDEGHEIVATIADHYLDPAVRDKVDQLLATDPLGLTSGTDIAHEATWADKFRDSDRPHGPRYTRTNQWHYVDIELNAPDIDAACFNHPSLQGAVATQGTGKDCVVDKIDELLAELQSPATNDGERLEALEFILHFVGDVHQPLHASDDNDQGGNGKEVSASVLGTGKLHGFWDTQFVEQLGSDPTVVAQQLIASITDADVHQWSQGTASDWANESFQIGRDQTYGKLPAPDAQGTYQLSDQYVAEATQVAAQQMKKAGVRLAWVLNRAFVAAAPVCTDSLRASAIPALTGPGITTVSTASASDANTYSVRTFFESSLAFDTNDPNGLPATVEGLLSHSGWTLLQSHTGQRLYASSWNVVVAGCGTLTGTATIVQSATGGMNFIDLQLIHFP